MIKASCILLFINAEEVPFLMDESDQSWDLAEFAEEYAYNIALAHNQKIKFSLVLSPERRAPRTMARTDTYRNLYRKNVLKALEKVDAVALLPGLGKAGEAPDWLKKAADEKYVITAPFASFFGNDDSSDLYVETSRRRTHLITAKRPQGREGRGGRIK